MSIGEQHVASALMHISRPQHLIRRAAAETAHEVPIAREAGVGIFVLAEGANGIAEVRVADLMEVFRGEASAITGADEKFRIHQII